MVLSATFQCRTQHCVSRHRTGGYHVRTQKFQCRTQHCMCRDTRIAPKSSCVRSFNAARSIVCVETRSVTRTTRAMVVSMPHAALCVSSPRNFDAAECDLLFQCRTQHCVCRDHRSWISSGWRMQFQCRTQHCVCRDSGRKTDGGGGIPCFNAARSIVCVETGGGQPRPRPAGGFNAARSIVCVETLCPAALVPRGLRRHFGKTRFFAPFLASADELCPEKRGIHRRCPLCGAGCTVLERRNGGMRLCARAGVLSISFSSYLMVAHASFFFNDVFASIQRGR